MAPFPSDPEGRRWSTWTPLYGFWPRFKGHTPQMTTFLAAPKLPCLFLVRTGLCWAIIRNMNMRPRANYRWASRPPLLLIAPICQPTQRAQSRLSPSLSLSAAAGWHFAQSAHYYDCGLESAKCWISRRRLDQKVSHWLLSHVCM